MGIDVVHPPNTIDVDYDLFWREVIDAVKHVELSHGLSYTIERGTKKCQVFWSEDESVHIFVWEVEPKQPTLLVPGAGED